MFTIVNIWAVLTQMSITAALAEDPDKKLIKKIAARALYECDAERVTTEEKKFLCFVVTHENVIRVKTRFSKNESKTHSSLALHGVTRAIEREDFDALLNFPAEDLGDALRFFESWESLKPVLTQAMERSSCESGKHLYRLGYRAETFLPSEEARTAMRLLYQKAIRCEPGDGTFFARYRLALFDFASARYESARGNLEVLAENEQSPYHLRAIFYLYRITKDEKYHELLKRKYPFSLHTIYLEKRTPEMMRKEFAFDDPPTTRNLSSEENIDPHLSMMVKWIRKFVQWGWPARAKAGFKYFLKLLPETRTDSFSDNLRVEAIPLLQAVNMVSEAYNFLSLVAKRNPAQISLKTMEATFPIRYDEIVKKESQGLDPNFVTALMRQESSFNPRAVSQADALGLMQLLHSTAKRYENVRRSQLFDPATNIRIGSKYLRSLIEMFSGKYELALAAYNAGEERVSAWLKRYPTEDGLLFLDFIPFLETRNYVAIVSRNYFWYRVVRPLGPSGFPISSVLQTKIERHSSKSEQSQTQTQ